MHLVGTVMNNSATLSYYYYYYHHFKWGWDSSVGIATRHRLDGPRIEIADPSGRAFYSVSLWPLACWDCGFESCRGHGYLCCVVYVVQ